MQSNKFTGIIGFVFFILLAIFLLINSFASGGASIAVLAKYLAFGSFFIGLMGKKFPFYLLVVYAFLSDLLKRALVIEGNFSQLDITFILMMCPLLMLGILSGAVAKCIANKSISKVALNCLIYAVFMGAVNVLLGVSPSGGVIGILQSFANVVSYFFLPFCFIVQFTKLSEYLDLLKFALIAGSLVALHALRQYVFGYPNFEYDYLATGYSSTADLNDINNSRPFSSLSSPGALAYTVGSMASLCFLLFFTKFKSALRFNLGSIFLSRPALLILFTLLLAGAICSKSRTQILATLAIIPFFPLFTSLKRTLLSYFLVFGTTATLFLAAGSLLENDFIGWWQNNVVHILVDITGLEPRMFTLSTFTIRLEGWENLTSNPEFWQPFGNPELKDLMVTLTQSELRALGLRSHDLLSSSLIKVGWVPILPAAIVGVMILIRFHKWMSSLEKNSLESYLARFGSLTLFAGYAGALAGGALAAFPVCLVLNLLFAMVFYAYKLQLEKNYEQFE